MQLPPSEYEGADGTAVAGMVVQKKYFVIAPKQPPKGQTKGDKTGKGKSGNAQPSYKLEVHLSGGKDPSNVVYLEAWGGTATDLEKLVQKGTPVSVQGAKYIGSAPKYSPSRCTYYLKAVGQIGLQVIVKTLTSEPWTGLEQDHPYLPLETAVCSPDARPVCLAGILLDEPMSGPVTCQDGVKQVANCNFQHGGTRVRLSFWEEAAPLLTSFSKGDVVFIFAGVAKNKGPKGWQIEAIKSTHVHACEQSLLERVNTETAHLLSKSDVVSLTKEVHIDYVSAPAKTVSVGALLSVPVADVVRDLGKTVYQVNDVTIIGISAPNVDDEWLVKSCKACKKHCTVETGKCPLPEHADKEVELRWMLKLDVADWTATMSALAWHDVFDSLPPFKEAVASNTSLTQAVKRNISQWLMAVPWTCRVVFKSDSYQKTNTLEIKTLDEVVGRDTAQLLDCWSQAVPPQARVGFGIAATGLKSCSFDKVQGHLLVKGEPCAAVRLLLQVEKQSNEDACVTTDPDSGGLRIVKTCACKLDGVSVDVVCAGPPSRCNWLNRANAGDVFLALCTGDPASTMHVKAQVVLSSQNQVLAWEDYVKKVSDKHTQDEKMIQQLPEATPLKRKALLDDTADATPKTIKARVPDSSA